MPRRDEPKLYGNWNSVFARFIRSSNPGVWGAEFGTLAGRGPLADGENAIDSAIVRADQHAGGAKGGKSAGVQPLVWRLPNQNPPPHERHQRAADFRRDQRREVRDVKGYDA
jgi:hypothetical protein